jgi:phosphoesterase RecJ-like protein
MKEFIETYIQNKITCCIDHHIAHDPFTQIDIIDASSSSCSELLWEIISHRENGSTIVYTDPQVASSFYVWLTTDTGGTVALEYEKDPIRSHENALGMLRAGADKKTIIKRLNTITTPQLLFAKLLFERMSFSKHCLWIWYEGKEADALGLDIEQSKLAFRMMKDTSWMKVVIKFVRQGTSWYASIRTATNFNVRQIAEYFGGGGHNFAAGCKLPHPEWTVQDIEKIVRQIDDLVDSLDTH